MTFLMNILQLEIHIVPATIILLLLLPFSSIHKVRYYGCYIVYIFLLCVVSTLLIPVFLFMPKNVHNCVIAGELLKHISKLVGIQWELRGGDILRVERGAVIVANHQSCIDILGIFNIWKLMGKCTVVARKELLYAWPFGLSAWLAGVVFIDRSKGRVAHLQLNEAAQLVTNKQIKVWLFPEGTRNKNPDTFLPFKKGAFRMAIACQMPIIPVVYSPYYFLNHEKKYFGKGKVIIQCLEPVSTEGKSQGDIDSVMEEVREKMVKQYEQLQQQVSRFQH